MDYKCKNLLTAPYLENSEPKLVIQIATGYNKSVLKTAFINLSRDKRNVEKSNLAYLNHYKSFIDGLYGKHTAAALWDYNSKNLDTFDLKKVTNAKIISKACFDVI